MSQDFSQTDVVDTGHPSPLKHQNWGMIIGTGVILLFIVVTTINLTVYSNKLNLTADKTTISAWTNTWRVAGIILTIGAGGWLLWILFHHKPKRSDHLGQPKMQDAYRYIDKIVALLGASKSGHEQELLRQIHRWGQTIEAMSQTLNTLMQNNPLIQRDLQQLPIIIANLEQQLTKEANPMLQADLQQMLTQRQSQHQALTQLQVTRRRAEIQVDRTISVLGTVYSQLLTYRSTFHMVDYQHLADHVGEEVGRLQDYLEALEEVKGSKLPL
ncbi:MAG: hypothetical protein AAF629_29775 [Chloroflexota bacterium]